MFKEKIFTIRFIATTGIGIALYVALSLCLQVPVFQNYYLCLGYVVMAVYLYSFGIISGTIIGVSGCILHCLLISGLRGMPGWSLGNLFIGITLGITFKLVKALKNKPLQYIINIVATVLYTAVGMLLIKSYTEVLLYAQPFILRITNNSYAFFANSFVLVLSLPLCINLDRILQKKLNAQQ